MANNGFDMVQEVERLTENDDVVFKYEGRIYVRPVGRGIDLLDEKDDHLRQSLEELLAQGNFFMMLEVRRLKK